MQRLRGYLAPLLVCGCCLVGLSAGLGWLIEGAPAERVVFDNLDPDRQAALARRIVRVEQEIIGASGSSGEPIGVLLGQSTVREGIDERTLGRVTGVRWLNLGASGGSFRQLAYYSRPLLASRLRPRLVVVGVHVEWLANGEVRAESQRVRLAGDGPFGELWFWRERNSMRNLAAYWLSSARHDWFAAWKQPLAVQIVPGRGAAFADDGRPSDDPWSAPRKYLTPRAPAHRLEQIMEHVASYGWFSAAAYRADNPEARALVSLCRDLSAFAPRVVLVLMPEEPSLRQRIPEVAERVFAQEVSSAAIPVLDHRGSMDDVAGVFYDPAHLNERGRLRYSDRLGVALEPILSGVR